MEAQAQEYCPTLADTLRSLELVERLVSENPNAALSVFIMAGSPDLTVEGSRMLRIVGEVEVLQYYKRRVNSNLADVNRLDRIFRASPETYLSRKGVSSRPRTGKLRVANVSADQILAEPIDIPMGPWQVQDAGEATLNGLIGHMLDDIDAELERLQKEEEQDHE